MPRAASVHDFVWYHQAKPSREDIQPTTECGICAVDLLQDITEGPPVKVPCGHMFCKNCLMIHVLETIGLFNSCPLCRDEFFPANNTQQRLNEYETQHSTPGSRIESSELDDEDEDEPEEMRIPGYPGLARYGEEVQTEILEGLEDRIDDILARAGEASLIESKLFTFLDNRFSYEVRENNRCRLLQAKADAIYWRERARISRAGGVSPTDLNDGSDKMESSLKLFLALTYLVLTNNRMRLVRRLAHMCQATQHSLMLKWLEGGSLKPEQASFGCDLIFRLGWCATKSCAQVLEYLDQAEMHWFSISSSCFEFLCHYFDDGARAKLYENVCLLFDYVSEFLKGEDESGPEEADRCLRSTLPFFVPDCLNDTAELEY